MRALLVAVSLLGALASAAPSSARAQPAPSAAAAEAKAHYDRGIVAYNLGHFEEAIASFTRAYELDPAPILLFNVAQAHYKAGTLERALFFYRRYLESEPAAQNRDRVEARIQEIEAALADRKAGTAGAGVDAASAAPSLPPAAPPVLEATGPTPLAGAAEAASQERPFYRRPWFWGAAGAVVGAVVLTVLLTSSRKGAPWPCTTDCNLGTYKEIGR
jgi:tetratricopeptide (TPR) repeat protein